MSQIPSVSPFNPVPQRSPTNGFGEMSSEDFIRIIFTELSHQDPFQPNDSSALLDQLNSIRSIESDIKLTAQLEALVLGNKMASAGNLLGQIVGGLSQTNDRVLGFVISVNRQADEVFLELDSGDIIPFDNVETVVDPIVFQDPQQNPPVGEDTPPTNGDGNNQDDTPPDTGSPS